MQVMKESFEGRGRSCWRRVWLRVSLVCVCVSAVAGCKSLTDSMSARPETLGQVPAAKLAFRFEPDVDTAGYEERFSDDEANEPLAAIKSDFETRRTEEALIRTIVSPDGQRALALYATAETPEGDFRMDLYSSAGQFLRNILPPELSGTFPQTVAWSPDGQHVAFLGIRNAAPQATPTPALDPLVPDPSAAPLQPGQTPAPAASATPLIAPVPVFNTEQLYVCDAYGYNIRPLTTRDGLIYFEFEWSPDSQRVAALACKPDEWDARRREDRPAAGRPRLIELDGRERLLADRLSDAAPAWSPDASKVAAAFDTDVSIFDVAGDAPTAANLPLREPLLTASAGYDAQKLSAQTAVGSDAQKAPNNQASASTGGSSQPPAAIVNTAPPAGETPLSFNPIVRLEWTAPEKLFVRTAFLRLYRTGEVVRNYPRWHALHLSPQAALLSLRHYAPRSPGRAASAVFMETSTVPAVFMETSTALGVFMETWAVMASTRFQPRPLSCANAISQES